MEVVGQTHTKSCIDCGVELTLGENWTSGPAKAKYYICRSCIKKRNDRNNPNNNKKRMWVNGKYISNKHPLYRPGSYKSFGDAAFESLSNYRTAKEGQVYILYSPAYPSWVKIGMAVDAEDRLKQFQTGSPYRDYVLVKAYDTKDRRRAESEIHELLRKTHGNKNEWFVIAAPVAKKILDGYFDENN